MKKKVLAMVIASMMSATLFAGCGSSSSNDTGNDTKSDDTNEDIASEDETTKDDNSSEGSTPRNETLYFNGQQWGTINNFNPMSANSNNAMGITQNDSARVLIYETLFLYNMLDGSLEPLLGETYEWNDEQTQLTIKINNDAKWSDGTDVTADDVVYTFDTHVKYGSSTGNDYKNYIEKVEATDSKTVVFYSKLDESGNPINPLKVIEYIPKIYVMQKAYLQTVEERNNNDAEKVKEDRMDD
ncbi:MAG: ABC transporter substrate-binding protein, partial [Clostridium saudiense]|nr:ABC transporter substrate-binding protein [Clostridium saudiense]